MFNAAILMTTPIHQWLYVIVLSQREFCNNFHPFYIFLIQMRTTLEAVINDFSF